MEYRKKIDREKAYVLTYVDSYKYIIIRIFNF